MKKTKWFNKQEKPSLPGVYEVDDDDGTGSWFANWDGNKFGFRHSQVVDAFRLREYQTCCPGLAKWRGLAQDPNAA